MQWELTYKIARYDEQNNKFETPEGESWIEHHPFRSDAAISLESRIKEVETDLESKGIKHIVTLFCVEQTANE